MVELAPQAGVTILEQMLPLSEEIGTCLSFLPDSQSRPGCLHVLPACTDRCEVNLSTNEPKQTKHATTYQLGNPSVGGVRFC